MKANSGSPLHQPLRPLWPPPAPHQRQVLLITFQRGHPPALHQSGERAWPRDAMNFAEFHHVPAKVLGGWLGIRPEEIPVKTEGGHGSGGKAATFNKRQGRTRPSCSAAKFRIPAQETLAVSHLIR